MKPYFIHWSHIAINWFIDFYTTEKGQSSRKCHWNVGDNKQKNQLFDWATYNRRPYEYKQPGDVVEWSRWCLGQWRNIQLQSTYYKSYREDWYFNIVVWDMNMKNTLLIKNKFVIAFIVFSSI